jgi:hypothetical protein
LGPIRPPRLPSELIAEMAAAAAVPLKILGTGWHGGDWSPVYDLYGLLR